MNTIKISDLFSDCPIILIEQTPKQTRYYELKYSGEWLDGFSDQPVQVFVKKGKRISKKELRENAE